MQSSIMIYLMIGIVLFLFGPAVWRFIKWLCTRHRYAHLVQPNSFKAHFISFAQFKPDGLYDMFDACKISEKVNKEDGMLHGLMYSGMYFNGKHQVTVTDPALIKEAMNCSDISVHRDADIVDVSFEVFGAGVATLSPSVQQFKQHRKAIMPLLNASGLKNTEHVLKDHTMDFLSGLETSAAMDGSVVLTDTSLYYLTCGIIQDILLGCNDSAKLVELNSKLIEAMQIKMGLKMLLGKFQSDFILAGMRLGGYTSLGSRKRSVDTLLLRAIKRKRLAGDNKPSSLLSISEFTDEEVTNELTQLIAGGQNPLGTNFMMLLKNLATHPRVQENIHAEIETACTTQPYLHATIKESMRLYQTFANVDRTTLVDTTLGGVLIPANTFVRMNIFASNRDEKNWANASEFIPERFLKGAKEAEAAHPFTMPFGHGVHSCPGRVLAQKQMPIVLSLLLSKYRVELIDAGTVIYRAVLLESQGLKLRLIPRHAAPTSASNKAPFG